MSGIWRLQISDEFSAAHALRHYQGKCENMHGHNFTVEICVQGTRLEQDTEMLIDFKELKTILKNILRDLDHRILNDASPFDKINPTSENMAHYIFRAFAKKLGRDAPAQIVSSTVCEKPGQCASYMEE